MSNQVSALQLGLVVPPCPSGGELRAVAEIGRGAAPPASLSAEAQAAWRKSVFALLPDDVTARLLERAIERSLESGEIYYRGAQHESSSSVAMVVEGLLRLYVAAPDGRTLTMRYVGAGQVVGLRGLTLTAGIARDYAPFASDSVNGDAVRPSRIVRLAKADVLAAARASASVALALAREAAIQAMRDQQMLAANLFRPIRSRVALHLLDLSAPDRSGDLVVTASHRQIADAIGSVREVVTRALDRLQSEGLIERREGRLLLLRPERLSEISLSCGSTPRRYLMQFTIALPQSNRVSTPSAIHDVAQAAEELGFWALSVHDHIMWDGKWTACGSDTDSGRSDVRNLYEPLVTYAHVSAITTRVRLLLSIMLMPTREPLLTAKQLSTLDQLSGGRVLLGIGVGLAGNDTDPPYLSALSGNAAREWEALGVPVARRGRLSDERLAAMRALWADDITTYEGTLVRFADVAMYPKPAQAGGIPILIGGNSPAALKRTARGGHTWLPNHAKAHEVAMGVRYLKSLHKEYGTEFSGEVVHDCFMRLDDSADSARAAFPRVLREALGEDLPHRNMLGNPEDLIERVEQYAAAGVTALDLKPVYHSVDELLSMMRRFAENVMPAAARGA